MQKLKVEVLRDKPRSRKYVKGLVGSLHTTITSCSKALGDNIDSYLYVGTGQLALKVSEEGAETLLEKYKDLSRAYPEVKIESEFTPFVEAKGVPVIPGSSIKGNVRSRVELSLRAKGNEVRSCFIKASPPAPKPRRGMQGWRHHEVWGSVLFEDRGKPCERREEDSPVCLVCDMFGTTGLSSLTSFSDSAGLGVNLQRLKLQYGMNIMAAPPGSKFTGRVDFECLKPHELGLLLVGMGVLESRRGRPVLLGRIKYRANTDGYSFGKVTYSVDAFELSPLSESFEEVKPRSKVTDVKLLDGVIHKLVKDAKREFKDELIIEDEVMKVAKLT